jgi:hypothetical protein
VREKLEFLINDKVRASLEYAILISSVWINDRKVHISLLERDVAEVEMQFLPVYQKRGWGGQEVLIGFEVAEEHCDALRSQFKNSPKLARIIGRKLAYNIYQGYPVPEGLRAVACFILAGVGTFPRPKAVRPTLTHRNTLLVGLANRISASANIPVSAGEAVLAGGDAKPICGATIAAAALHAFGVEVNAAQACKVVYEKRYLFEIDAVSSRIFNLNVGNRVANALLGIEFQEDSRNFDISAFSDELSRALKWLSLPL